MFSIRPISRRLFRHKSNAKCKHVFLVVEGSCGARFEPRKSYHLKTSSIFDQNRKSVNINVNRSSHGSASHIEPFILPDIGEGINEVEIKNWLIKVGDAVKEFDGLCEVESDKATATISSRFEGTIARIHYEVGDMAKVGSPLVDIRMNNDGSESRSTPEPDIETAECSSEKLEPQIAQRNPRGTSQFAMLPSVRRLAMEHGADLSQIEATGKNGRILKEDLLRFLERGSGDGSNSPKVEHISPDPIDAKVSMQTGMNETRVNLRGIRRAMFKTMTQVASIPHFNYSDEVDMTRLIESSAKRNSEEKKISNFAIIIKMVSLALNQYPELNGSVDDSGEFMTTKHYHNIGVAVDSNHGLIVPNIKNVQDLTINDINSELLRLRQLAYESKLGTADLSGGTFTLSNIGAIGGVFGVPLLVPSELVIGALGRTRKVPRINSAGQIEARHVMQLVWSADHRVVDGATLSRFTNLLKTLLEEPESALIMLK